MVDANGTIVSNITTTSVVGRPVTYRIAGAIRLGLVKSFAWSIPADNVKSYSLADDRVSYHTLAAGDLDNRLVSFYWTSGGTKTIRCTVTIRGITVLVSGTVNVVRPTAISFTGRTSPVKPAIHFTDGWLRFGHPGGSEGIDFVGKATIPSPAPGDLAFVQLVDSEEAWWTTLGVYKWHVEGTPGFVLDDKDAKNGIYYSYMKNQSGYSVIQDGDTPGSTVPLFSKNSFRRNDKFKTYFMYRPNGDDSIWVTLAILKWDWKGRVLDNTGSWKLEFGYSKYTVDPVGVDSTELPKYSTIYTDEM